MDERDLEQIEAMMYRVVGIFAEDVQHKLDILSEGQQLLSEKVEATRTELKADIARAALICEAIRDVKVQSQRQWNADAAERAG
jgi:hypothetical protein